jgi:hypothetical protein
MDDFTYYTKLQGDGILITWQVDVNDITAISLIWQSADVNSDGEFFLVAECSARGDGVALYQGNPNQGGQSLWRHDPFPLPQTEAPTIAPVDAPSPCERSIFMERNDELNVGKRLCMGMSSSCSNPMATWRSDKELRTILAVSCGKMASGELPTTIPTTTPKCRGIAI